MNRASRPRVWQPKEYPFARLPSTKGAPGAYPERKMNLEGAPAGAPLRTGNSQVMRLENWTVVARAR